MVRYVTSAGEEAVLDGPGGVRCSRGSALDWGYSVKELNGRLAMTALEPLEFSLAASVSGPGAASALDALADALSTDAASGSAGRLYVGEWYRRCVPLSMAHEWCQGDGAFLLELGFRADDPAWVRAEEVELVPPDPAGLDFPHGFPHDYSPPAMTDSVRNRSPVPCPVRIRVQGPASDWSVRIGANAYSCDIPLIAGETACIDGSDETITVTRASGAVENAFQTFEGVFREGSGSYVFEPVAPGVSPVSWEGCSGVALTVYERRAEIGWSK